MKRSLTFSLGWSIKRPHYFILALAVALSAGCSKKELTGKEENVPAFGNMNMSSSLVLGSDPFTPYLASTPHLIRTISTGDDWGNGTVERITFTSKNGADTIFALYGHPKTPGIYPAILFTHGGGGNAESQYATMRLYASNGYVTMSFDEPGIALPKDVPNSSGPWKTMPFSEAARLNVTGGPQNSTLCDGIIAGLDAFNYLRSQPGVDPTKVAISGVSWGGYLTTMLSGLLGNKVKAAYASFGCGFYETGSYWSGMLAAKTPADRAVWETYLDAGRRAPYITAPYFIEQPTNDTYFWPEAVANTLNAIPGNKNRVMMPNLNHRWIPAAGLMRQTFLDYYLKGTGSPFGTIAIASAIPQGDGSIQVNMTTSVPAGVSASAVRLYYSLPATDWQTRHWDSVSAVNISANNYRAVISATLAAQHVTYYASLIDNRTIVTSTEMLPSLLPAFPSGTYKIVNQASGMVLDVKARLTANGSIVQQQNYGSATNQQWQVTSLGGGQYQIMGVQSGRSLDAAGQQTADGTPIDIYDYTGTASQKWIIAPVGGGLYTIKGVASGKLVEVVGGSSVGGALIDLGTNNNGNGQKWSFIKP